MKIAIVIIADDLTGAADSAVAFAKRGFKTDVLLEGMQAGDQAADVLAFTTETRDVHKDALPDKFDVLRSSTAEGVLLFKKIDSMLRGNTISEIGIATRTLPDHVAIISPAYPALGRVCIAGRMHWKDRAGEGTIDLAESLRRCGTQPISLPSGLDASFLSELVKEGRERGRVFLHDARTDEDLESVAHAGLSLGRSVLWIGSGGLAHALAHQFPKRSNPIRNFEPRSGTGLLFIGSDHPVTEAQVEMLRKETLTDISLIQIGRGSTHASNIYETVHKLEARNISFIFMTGGDTATLVCKALGIVSLAIESEFAPGVPVGRAKNGVFDGVPVVLKSGGFGEPDLLCRICREVRANTRVNA